MLEKYEIVSQFYHRFNYKKFFSGTAKEKMQIIPAAMEHILSQKDGKKRYLKEVIALTKSYSLSVPSPEAEKVRDDVGFFQAIKASIVKNTETTGKQKTDAELNTAIKQIVSKAVASEGVIDIFEAAGMKKPEISILSDSFLDDVKNMEHKNLALESLKRLLEDQVRVRFSKNKIKDKKFSQMLQDAIMRYQNRSIDSAQIIQELIDIAKKIREEKSKGKELGLSEPEEAFYDALANNESAVNELGKDLLIVIAKELTKTVRNNTSIDWTLRENVQMKLRVMIKRLLRKYGYPPDQQKVATDLVLDQAKLFANDWALEEEIGSLNQNPSY
jgi:type I restriction enzyme R subunit